MPKTVLFLFFIIGHTGQAFPADFSLRLEGNIEITAREEVFFPADHKLKGCDVPLDVCEIDNHRLLGSASIPKTTLSKLVVKVAGVRYELETSGMFDPLLGPDIRNNFGGYCYDPKNCSFRAALGDAGGVYSAEWVIRNGHAYRTMLTDSSDTFEFIKYHLLPPQYN